jgi:hypothetical protein
MVSSIQLSLSCADAEHGFVRHFARVADGGAETMRSGTVRGRVAPFYDTLYLTFAIEQSHELH